MRGLTIASAALLAGAGAAAAPQDSTAVCARGLHIVVARGTGEPKGTGVTGALAAKIAAQIAGSTVEPLTYPATITSPNYNESVNDGVRAMQGALDRYTAACPDGRVAVMGYSQGAQLTMDAVCGGVGGGFNNAVPLAANKVKDNIVAIVLFGDPTHRANLTYDKGTSINNGVFDRANASIEVCTRYADRLVSYCDTGDVYCDSGKDKKVHGAYVLKYGDDMVKYIVGKYNAAAGDGERNATAAPCCAATTAAPTGSATATGAAAPTATTAGASGLLGGGSLYLAVPLAVLAVFQAL